MPTTSDYLTKLASDKSALATNLVTKGVQASTSETFTSLVPKVLDISGGGGTAPTLPFEYLSFAPISVTYPNPTIFKYPVSMTLTAGQSVVLDVYKNGDDPYSEEEEIVRLGDLSEMFGDRLGLVYSSNNVQFVLINDCSDIDISQGTVTGNTGVVIYGYGENDYVTFTLREPDEESES